MKLFYIVAIYFSIFFSTNVTAADVTRLQWDDLLPDSAKTEDPLAGLSDEEAGFIEWIIYLREYLPEEIDPVNQEFYDQITREMPELKRNGYDVDQIISERKLKTMMLNSALDGKKVMISGYLLPLDMSQTLVSEFLLVPSVGACIHTPPPPPNQIVHIKMNDPVEFSFEEAFKPVSLIGVLNLQRSSEELYLVDGTENIDIGYLMKAETIKSYKH